MHEMYQQIIKSCWRVVNWILDDEHASASLSLWKWGNLSNSMSPIDYFRFQYPDIAILSQEKRGFVVVLSLVNHD